MSHKEIFRCKQQYKKNNNQNNLESLDEQSNKNEGLFEIIITHFDRY